MNVLIVATSYMIGWGQLKDENFKDMGGYSATKHELQIFCFENKPDMMKFIEVTILCWFYWMRQRCSYTEIIIWLLDRLDCAVFISELLGGEISPQILRFPQNAEIYNKLYLKYKISPN